MASWCLKRVFKTVESVTPRIFEQICTRFVHESLDCSSFDEFGQISQPPVFEDAFDADKLPFGSANNNHRKPGLILTRVSFNSRVHGSIVVFKLYTSFHGGTGTLVLNELICLVAMNNQITEATATRLR